jgi:uncharacterized protein (DUF362 family)
LNETRSSGSCSRLSRRRFLTLALKSIAGSAAAGGVLSSCRDAQTTPHAQPEAPVATAPGNATAIGAAPASPTPAPEPAATLATAPTPTPTSLPEMSTPQPDLVTRAPDGISRVVRTRHAHVWDEDVLSAEALQHMIARSITALTGVDDARAAWAALFAPDERIAIKVNAFRNSLIWTHVPLVTAVTDALQDAGIPAENILIFDYLTSELEEAGFSVNREDQGVRCYGTDSAYTGGFQIVGTQIELSDCLLGCDALINMPVLKAHMLAGLTFALKNHYGTLRTPQNFHAGTRINHGMAELNALAPIKDRTRLVIGDALTACLRYGNAWPYWKPDYTGDAILMSFDPVATDAVALDMLATLMRDNSISSDFALRTATPWLEHATEIGLGTHRLDEINIQELLL